MTERSDRLIDTTDELCDQILENRCILRHKFFITYAWSRFRRTGVYGTWRNFLSYFRKFRAVALVIRIASFILAVLQTGALVLLSTVLFLIIIPFLSAFMLGVLITALLESRRSNRYLQKKLDGKQIYVLFLSKRENPFFCANVQLLSQESTHAVVIVSPYWLSGRGLGSHRFYCTFRRDGERIFLVRRYYFFQLKKQLAQDKLIYMF